MALLTEYVDRLSSLASSICASASAAGRSVDSGQDPSSSAGPFTRAVLETHLGDLIREIDPSEIGLFTLVQPSTHASAQAPQEDAPVQKAEIARVSLPVATPLRRPPTATNFRREDTQRPGEYEPEVYANAALKFLDRYQSIRHMPRYQEQAETLIEQLAAVRQSFASLTQELKQASSSSLSEQQLLPSAKVKEEERRIEVAQAKINELQKRKEELSRKQQRMRPKSVPKPKSKPVPQSPPPPDEQEETFWNTPGAAARTLHFTDDLLTDEQIDIGDLSALASPLPGEIPARTVPRHIPRAGPSRGRALQFTRSARGEEGVAEVSADERSAQGIQRAEKDAKDDDDRDDDSDTTVIMDKRAQRGSPAYAPGHAPQPAPSAVGAVPPRPEASPSPVEKSDDPELVRARDTDPERKAKVKVTTDTERIVSKIWTTVGDIVMPGHSFDLSGSKSGPKPPRAKETIAHLQSIASQTASISSPSASSISFSSLSLATAQGQSNQPTAQQILTAQMLLALLNSPPSYAMPLNKLKEVLIAASGQNSAVTRPLYGCVAKRLLKIDRGGGEQVVRFDV